MGKCFVFLLILYAGTVLAQVNDNLTDGNFSASPAWQGDISAFIVNSDKQLQPLSGLPPQTIALSITNTLCINTSWEFYLKLNLDPSANNLCRIYLMTNSSDLKGNLNGYFLQAGENGNADSFDLYRQNGSTVTKIIDGRDSIARTNPAARIRVTRNSSGLWELKSDVNGGTDFTLEGTGTDNTFSTTSWFGVYCKFSTGNSNKFIFDDFKIEQFITDNTPPKLVSATVIDSTTIDVLFDEPLDSTSVKNNSNFSLSNSYNAPLSITTTANQAKYRLKFIKGLGSGMYVLTVTGIKDRNNNTISSDNTASFSYTKPYIAAKNDLVLNEIFADPAPQADLPGVEFMEVFNTTNHTVYLQNWKFADATTTAIFPSDSIRSGQFLILSAKTDTAEFKRFGKVIGLSPWPSLNNSSDVLKLISPENKVIDSVAYRDMWYRDTAKKQGGWSLERIDPRSLCQGLFNWSASIDQSGGSPGKQNSIFRPDYDKVTLKADSLKQLSDSTIMIFLNKPVDASILDATKLFLKPAMEINAISFDTQYNQAMVVYDQKLSPATSYTLIISGITDCNGINVPASELTFETAKLIPPTPIRTDTAEIVITEIFADPSPEVGLPLVEFVELYNPGKDTIDLDGWTLNDPGTKAAIKKSKIPPGEYVILCPLADTLQYNAFGKTTGISPWPSLNNSSDQVVLKSFKNRSVDSISYSDGWYKDVLKKQGGWSLEKIDPGSLCQGLFNWSASIDLSGGTPGKQNSVFNPAYSKLILKADSLIQLSDSTLRISFNKPVDSSIIDSTKLYLSPTAKISALSIDIQNRYVNVTYNSRFKPATLYTLTISGVKDCSGISIPSNQLTFQTASIPLPPPPLPIRADTAKIHITEIFADPSPEIELPLAEFVELYNPGKDTVDLDSWTLNDPGMKTTIKKSKILPGEYLILCPAADTLQYKIFGKVVGISPWPSLNNSSDQIVLKSFKNRVVDSISYSDSWYKDLSKKQGGWSLERIDPGSSCQGLFNWSASIDRSGGTPGKQNSIFYPDYDKLILKADSMRQLSDSTVRVFFNKPVNESIIDASKLQLNPGAEIRNISFDSQYRQVTVVYSQNFHAETSYTLTISKLIDCNGISAPDYQFTFQTNTPPPLAVPSPLRIDTGKIYITEIFADPSPEIGLPLAEFVELYNPGKDTINLDGWTLNDPGTKATIKNSRILPGSYAILCPATDTLQYKAFGKTIGISPWPSLNNSAEQIILKSFKSRTVDSVSYRDTWYKDAIKKSGGWSMELIDIQTICSGSQNWIASMNSLGGTPGKQNSVYKLYATNEPLKLISVVLTDSITLALNFNRPADSISASVIQNYRLNNGVGNPASMLSGADYDQIILKFSSSIARGNNYQLTVKNLTDCAGITIPATGNTAEFLYPEKIVKNDIVISEILFNPRQGGADFVEIYNRSDKLLDLQDLFLATANDKDSLVSLKQLSPIQLLMKPHTYLALSTDPDNIKKEYSPISSSAFLKVPSLPAFNDEAGVAVLVSNNTRIDQLNYSAKMHFALIKDPEGVSLERSSFNRPTNENGNFYSASASSGYATPGYQNSQFTEEIIPLEEISLISKTFSPDNDGFEDLLILNYHLTKPGCIANAIVYDTKGVVIRKLARNQTLAEQGTIIWDGLTETNEICPVGIYIVYLEIFNLDGTVKKYRKNCVLAARLN